MPLTRRHFCESATRGDLATSLPRNRSLNWFIPAFVNISVGSSLTTIGADGTMVCCFELKKSKNFWRISCEVISLSLSRYLCSLAEILWFLSYKISDFYRLFIKYFNIFV